MRFFLTILSLLFTLFSVAQKKSAWVSGKAIDENERPVSNASVVILGRTTGLTTNDTGYFRIKVPADRSFALVFSHTGYADVQKNFYLSDGEEEKISILMEKGGKTLETVVVSENRERTETGLTRINPKSAIRMPSTTGGIESMIKILVGTNNELNSQYSVRGGNYDENLIYINYFDNCRPSLLLHLQ